MLNSIFNAIKKAKQQGFFYIIISSSLVKIVSFISAIFLPRIIINKADYGLLVYIDNIMNYVLLINGLGIANSTLRFCSKENDPNIRNKYFLSSIIIGIVFDLLLMLLTLIAFLTIPFSVTGASSLLILMSFMPILVFLFEDIQLFLRACLKNKEFSFLSLTYSVMMVAFQIIFAIFWNVKGALLGRYIAVSISIIIAYFLLDISVIKIKKNLPPRSEIIQMIKFGFIMSLTNASSLLMQLNEVFIIGIILKNTLLLADYKIASYILTISLFLTQSIVLFTFPYFVKKSDNKDWIWRNFKKVSFANAIIMIPLHILLIILAKPIILIVFGEQYLNSTFIMQMLLIASLGQCLFRMFPGNILSGIGNEQYNLKLNIITLIVHAIIDIWAIKNYGIAGAALGLIVVYFVSGIILTFKLKKVCSIPAIIKTS